MIAYEIQLILGTDFTYIPWWDGMVIHEESMKIKQILMACFFHVSFGVFLKKIE